MRVIKRLSNDNIIMCVWNGDAGLAKSCWVYGIAAWFVWIIAIGLVAPVPNTGVAKFLLACMALYFIFVSVGIWRAASKYQGKAEWGFWARVAVLVCAWGILAPIFVDLFQYVAVKLYLPVKWD